MRRQVEVARTYTRDVAARHDAGEFVVAEACLAKQTAVDCAAYVCDRAVQLHGGAGYMHGTEVERHYRDARILPIGGGADEVLTTWRPSCWAIRRLCRPRAPNERNTMLKLPSLGDEVSVWMDATPAAVWDLVSDVTRIGEFSPRPSRPSGPAGRPVPRWGRTSPAT